MWAFRGSALRLHSSGRAPHSRRNGLRPPLQSLPRICMLPFEKSLCKQKSLSFQTIPVPEPVEGPVSKPYVIQDLAIVSFSGSTRESVKAKIRHSGPRPGICKIKKSPTLDEPHF